MEQDFPLESRCSLEYIDILVQRGDFNELLYFYNLCSTVREFLNRRDKLYILGNFLGRQFDNFDDLSEYYTDMVINVLPIAEAIEFVLEFPSNSSITSLLNRFPKSDTYELRSDEYYEVEKYNKMLVRKLRVNALSEDYDKLATIAKILFRYRGFITSDDIMVARNPEKTKQVINEAVGRQLFSSVIRNKSYEASAEGINGLVNRGLYGDACYMIKKYHGYNSYELNWNIENIPRKERLYLAGCFSQELIRRDQYVRELVEKLQ